MSLEIFTKVYEEMHGQKVSCIIENQLIMDCTIWKELDHYYLLQNMASGSKPRSGIPLGYQRSWTVGNGDNTRKYSTVLLKGDINPRTINKQVNEFVHTSCRNEFVEAVEEYLDTYGRTPLKFSTDTLNDEELRTRCGDVYSGLEENLPIQLVLRAFMLAWRHNSINAETGNIETYNGRSRSSYDLWRHVIYWDQSVTIYEVMEALTKLTSKSLGIMQSSYCGTVKRRVFWTGRGDFESHDESYIDSSLGGWVDEFGTIAPLWKIATQLHKESLEREVTDVA